MKNTIHLILNISLLFKVFNQSQDYYEYYYFEIADKLGCLCFKLLIYLEPIQELIQAVWDTDIPVRAPRIWHPKSTFHVWFFNCNSMKNMLDLPSMISQCILLF